jgi:hypothetical protein
MYYVLRFPTKANLSILHRVRRDCSSFLVASGYVVAYICMCVLGLQYRLEGMVQYYGVVCVPPQGVGCEWMGENQNQHAQITH